MRKRCVALLLAVLLLGSLAAPALAAGSEPVISTGTFWQSLAADSPDFIGNVIGVFDKGTCTVSEDRRHHGKVIRKADPVFGEPGAWLALCDYCGENFKVYDDDMQNAYDEHVNSLPSTGITSDGGIIWHPLYSDPIRKGERPGSGDDALLRVTFYDGSMSTCSFSNFSGKSYSYCNLSIWSFTRLVFDNDMVDLTVSGFDHIYGLELLSPRFRVPIEGNYTLLDYGPCSAVFEGVRLPITPANPPTIVNKYCVVDDFLQVSYGRFYSSDSGSGRSSLLMSVGTPYFKIVPVSGPLDVVGGDTYNISSRVGNLTGDYGIIGDNGTIIKSDTQYIVNETTNIFTNPATGTTAPVSDWTYDYSDRSYHLTLEGGDTVTVTYGDENVTINQGGDTYNIYYIVPGGGEVEPTPTPPPTDPPTPTETVSPTDPPGPTEPVDPDAPPDTTGWGILDFLKGIFDFLWGLGEKLIEPLKTLLKWFFETFFQPKEESIKELEDKVSEKLPFISDLQDFGDQFSDVLHNPAKSARSMTFTTVVDLGRKSGGISYGSGQANILDMTWYLDYKPMVDDIIEGVAWLVFLWNLYGALPTIIHGGASGLHTTAGLVKWKEENDDVG